MKSGALESGGEYENQNGKQEIKDDGYRFQNIEAVQKRARKMFKFTDDIDNNEEDDLTDDELKKKVVARKQKERNLRDELWTVQQACQESIAEMKTLRQSIKMSNAVAQTIDLVKLKHMMNSLKEKMDDEWDIDAMQDQLKLAQELKL